MSITTISGGGQSDSKTRYTRQRKNHRSLKAHRAITAARRFNVALPSYHTADIYKALENAQIRWNCVSQEWEPKSND